MATEEIANTALLAYLVIKRYPDGGVLVGVPDPYSVPIGIPDSYGNQRVGWVIPRDEEGLEEMEEIVVEPLPKGVTPLGPPERPTTHFGPSPYRWDRRPLDKRSLVHYVLPQGEDRDRRLTGRDLSGEPPYESDA